MNDAASPWDLVDQAFSSPSVPKPNKLQQAVQDMTPLKGKTCLVVDTALATRRAIQEQLSQLGSKGVVFAGSVSEVEQQLIAREFALIICEYQLDGDRNGQQLLEELRVGNKIPWNTAFVMITGERSYSSVISVAEFEPDDYLIKPFTASTLSDRVVKIFNKKNRLAEAYEAFFERELGKVPSICTELEKTFPQYSQELNRMRIDSFLLTENHVETENELTILLLKSPKPWMKLKMAKLKAEQRKFNEAGDLLEEIVKNNPEYLMASDMYSDVLWEQNKPVEALEILERMGAKALNSTTRLRKLADLSVRLGDDSKSKTYLTKVIDRSRNSSLSQIHDYLQLSKIYIQEGRVEEAERLTSRMRNTVNSSDLDLARTLMTIQKLIVEQKYDKAKEKLNDFYENYETMIDKLEIETQTSLLEQCFAADLQQRGYDMARLISKRKPSKALLDRIKNAISMSKK